jgi:hypothetical protein
MWWAARFEKSCRPSKTVGAHADVLNQQTNKLACLFGPTQMAIPLQMDEDPEQLVAANRRVQGVTRKTHIKE